MCLFRQIILRSRYIASEFYRENLYRAYQDKFEFISRVSLCSYRVLAFLLKASICRQFTFIICVLFLLHWHRIFLCVSIFHRDFHVNLVSNDSRIIFLNRGSCGLVIAASSEKKKKRRQATTYSVFIGIVMNF